MTQQRLFRKDRGPPTLKDLEMFDDHTIDRMWMEGGYMEPAHLRGICPEHCPYCREGK